MAKTKGVTKLNWGDEPSAASKQKHEGLTGLGSAGKKKAGKHEKPSKPQRKRVIAVPKVVEAASIRISEEAAVAHVDLKDKSPAAISPASVSPEEPKQQDSLGETEFPEESARPSNLLTSQRAREIAKLKRGFQVVLPPVHCNNCAFQQQCPKYKADFECAFEIEMGIRINSLDDIKQAQLRVTEVLASTFQRGLIQQQLAGGVIDPNTTNLGSLVFEQLAGLREAERKDAMGHIPQVGQQQEGGKGILAQLFNFSGANVQINNGQPEVKPIKLEPITEQVTEEPQVETPPGMLRDAKGHLSLDESKEEVVAGIEESFLKNKGAEVAALIREVEEMPDSEEQSKPNGG